SLPMATSLFFSVSRLFFKVSMAVRDTLLITFSMGRLILITLSFYSFNRDSEFFHQFHQYFSPVFYFSLHFLIGRCIEQGQIIKLFVAPVIQKVSNPGSLFSSVSNVLEVMM